MPMTPRVRNGSKIKDDKAVFPGKGARSSTTQATSLTMKNASALTDLASHYLKLLLLGDRQTASTIIIAAVDGGMSVRDIYLDVFQPVQREIGQLWQANLVSVALEHFCTAATQVLMSQLFPRILSAVTVNKELSMVGCCVGKELHELGMRMVCDFFEMDGWETHYMGANCPNDLVLAALELRTAHLLCLSVTMPQNLVNARDMIRKVSTQFPKIKIIVGGGPFLLNPRLAKSLGADGWARDADGAVTLGLELVDA